MFVHARPFGVFVRMIGPVQFFSALSRAGTDGNWQTLQGHSFHSAFRTAGNPRPNRHESYGGSAHGQFGWSQALLSCVQRQWDQGAPSRPQIQQRPLCLSGAQLGKQFSVHWFASSQRGNVGKLKDWKGLVSHQIILGIYRSFLLWKAQTVQIFATQVFGANWIWRTWHPHLPRNKPDAHKMLAWPLPFLWLSWFGASICSLCARICLYMQPLITEVTSNEKRVTFSLQAGMGFVPCHGNMLPLWHSFTYVKDAAEGTRSAHVFFFLAKLVTGPWFSWTVPSRCSRWTFKEHAQAALVIQVGCQPVVSPGCGMSNAWRNHKRTLCTLYRVVQLCFNKICQYTFI